MKTHLIFIGNKFIYNAPLKEYILRNIEKNSGFINEITYLKESENALFLYIEEELNAADRVILITSKQNFSTIGKVICTATGDNQILQDAMLIPQKATIYAERSYLLEHQNTSVNVLQIDEGQKMPEILFTNEETKATVHVFEEEKEVLISILNPIAQMYEVNFFVTQEVDGWLRVDIASNRYGDISKFIHACKNLLPKKLITSANIVEYIIDKLSHHGKKVSFSESCTGGLLAYYFTKHNGASKILDGSLVTYSNALKENWLAVSHEVLEANGAVSAEVVAEMSEGALNVSGADYALSISGIAGDTGGTKEKPVGTVYIGARSQTKHKERHLQFQGDRNYVQHQSALYAIKMLLMIDKETFF
ncbi:CinA family protein [Sulfurimonas sp.]|uniref:CinA family protein n=1 Tax=Sulfurimonas sp. TaxID=2022749 RepID=UPI002610B4DD|nr:CinA family protein [Sulfurimonas sp.]